MLSARRRARTWWQHPIEGRIDDLFDDAAFPKASTLNFAPTLSDHLGRLRGLMRSGSNELFKSRLLADFCNHPALKDQAPALQLLNKAHHSSKTSIKPKEVSDVLKDLARNWSRWTSSKASKLLKIHPPSAVASSPPVGTSGFARPRSWFKAGAAKGES